MSPKIIWYIIINPTAGSGRVKREWPKIQSQLNARSWSYIAVETKKAGEATQLAKEAVEKGYSHIIAVGGDGTNNEVINGILLQQAIPSLEVTYILLPIGTGNDWIKTHKIPRRIDLWLDMVERGNTSIQDIGKVTYQSDGKTRSRYFANVAGMGYDAFVARIAESQKGKVGNKLFYFYLVFKCLAQYTLKKAKVIFDNQEQQEVYYTIHAGICRYSGGGMSFVPHAKPNDGQFALTMIRNISKPGIVLNSYRLYTGSIGQLKQTDTFYAKNIRVEALEGQATLVEVDGEFLGETPVEFSLLEKSLKLIVPCD